MIDSNQDDKFLAFSIISNIPCPKQQIQWKWKGFVFSFSEYIRFNACCIVNHNKEINDVPNIYQQEPYSNNIEMIRKLENYGIE